MYKFFNKRSEVYKLIFNKEFLDFIRLKINQNQNQNFFLQNTTIFNKVFNAQMFFKLNN